MPWLVSPPAWFIIFAFTFVPAAVVVGAHAIFRRIVKADRLIAHHDVAGFLVAVVGVLYAVVLGFLVVNVWAAYDSSQRNADNEAGDVGELFSLAQSFREPTRSLVRTALADYAFEVRDVEWPMLAYRKQDRHARELMLRAFRGVVASPVKATTLGGAIGDETLRAAAFTELRDLSMNRRQRLLDAESHLPEPLYLALAMGALIVVAFVFLFGVDDAVLQLTMTGLVVGTIGLLIGVIVQFDRPYNGGIHVSNAAWTLVIENNDLAEFRSPPPGPAPGKPHARE